MVQKQHHMGLELRDVDESILDLLHEGRNVPSNLGDELGHTRQYIQQRLGLLEAADHVQNVGRGVYEVIDDPRESVGRGSGTIEDCHDAVLSARTDLEDVIEEMHRDNAQSAFGHAKDALETLNEVDV